MSDAHNAVREGVIDCVLKVRPSLDRERLGPATSLRDLGLSSLEVIAVVFEIEEHFNVELVDVGHDRFTTIGEAITILNGLPGVQTQA